MPRYLFTRARLCAGVTALCLSAFASTATAGVTTLRFDLPGIPLGFFGQQWTQDFLVDTPLVRDTQIVDTRYHLEFDTENAVGGSLADAANFAVQFQPPTINVPFVTFSGADLGWAGTGQFTADFNTSAFNEPMLDFPPDSVFVFFFGRIVNLDDLDPFLGGLLTNSYIEVDVAPVPEPGSLAILGLGGMALIRRRKRR